MILSNSFIVAFFEQVFLTFCWVIVGVVAFGSSSGSFDLVNDKIGNFISTSCGSLNGNEIVGLICFQNGLYFFISALFTLVDNYYDENNELSVKRLVNPGRRPLKHVQWDLVRLANHTSLINSILSVICHFLIYSKLFEWRGVCDSLFFENAHSIFDWILLFVKIPLLVVLADFTFYFGHRLFHESSFLYQNYHKFHHKFVDSYAIAAIAAHPVEFILVSLPTLSLPILILNVPIGIGLIWTTIGTINTLHSHCGYHSVIVIPIFGLFEIKFGGVPHDFHHHFQSTEFGAGGIADSLFKTRMQDRFPKAWNKLISLYQM